MSLKFIVFVVLLLLAGCTVSNNQVTTLESPTITVVLSSTPHQKPITLTTINSTPKPTPDLDLSYVPERWLSSTTCLLPCWEGITPGVTTYEDAVKMIESLPYIDPTSFDYYDDRTHGSSIGWDYIDPVLGGVGIFLDNNNRIVNNLRMFFPSRITILDFFQMVGEPEYVAARVPMGPHGEYLDPNLDFFYFEKGIRITTLSGDLSPDELLLAIELHPKTTLADKPDWAEYEMSFLVAWEGFQDFRFYCRDPEEYESCYVFRP